MYMKNKIEHYNSELIQFCNTTLWRFMFKIKYFPLFWKKKKKLHKFNLSVY